jgi:disulfide bond formation protein DsbB
MSRPDAEFDSNWILLFLCWLLAGVSMAGSLFFSEVMGFAPCLLCWYQRICLFPLVLVLAVGLFPLDRSVVKYALPLAVVGWGIAAYHNLVHAGIIPESLAPCSQGVSCTEEYIEWLGFLSIPMLSLLSFSAIAILLILVKRGASR